MLGVNVEGIPADMGPVEVPGSHNSNPKLIVQSNRNDGGVTKKNTVWQRWTETIDSTCEDNVLRRK